MSQFYTAQSTGGGGGGGILTLTGNDTVAVGPNGSGNVNLVGSGSIVVTNTGPNTETISQVGGGIVWLDKATDFAVDSNTGYFVSATSPATITATLPASPSQSDTVEFITTDTGLLTIKANTGQMIRIGVNITGGAGSVANTMKGDGIELVYRAADTTWYSFASPQGTWS